MRPEVLGRDPARDREDLAARDAELERGGDGCVDVSDLPPPGGEPPSPPLARVEVVGVRLNWRYAAVAAAAGAVGVAATLLVVG